MEFEFIVLQNQTLAAGCSHFRGTWVLLLLFRLEKLPLRELNAHVGLRLKIVC